MFKSTQDLLRIQQIKDGIICLKDNQYCKIIKILPINFTLKSVFEKKIIIEKYNEFLKKCTFDFQIIIKNKKENVDNHIEYLKEQLCSNNEAKEEYINFISNYLNSKNLFSKEFYMIISVKQNESVNSFQQVSKVLDQYFLIIKESLIKCGNDIKELSSENDDNIIKILSFLINEKETAFL